MPDSRDFERTCAWLAFLAALLVVAGVTAATLALGPAIVGLG